MRGTGVFWEGILVSPFEIVYTIPMKKFGIRYPDGVEPSHTDVCYHKILFDADYLGRGRHPINFNKSQNNDKLLKYYFFYIHLKSRYCFKVSSKKNMVKCLKGHFHGFAHVRARMTAVVSHSKEIHPGNLS